MNPMCDLHPDKFSSYEYKSMAPVHDDWISFDEDPFQPLPLLDKKGAYATNELPPAEGVTLSEDEINLMLPLLLNNQDQEDNAGEDVVNDLYIFKKNEPTSSSLYSKTHSTAPKNVRSGRPAKRPLDEHSAFLRNERTRIISSHKHPDADLHDAEAYLSTLNKKIKEFNSSKPTISSLGVTQPDDGEQMKPYSENHASPKTDISFVKFGFVPPANKSTPTADPILYEVLQTYKTLKRLPMTSSTLPVQSTLYQKTKAFPHPQWHWHNSSEPLCIPPPEVVSVKDLNGTPQAFKVVYTSITLPYDLARKFDPVVLYESTKGAMESLISSSNKLNAGD